MPPNFCRICDRFRRCEYILVAYAAIFSEICGHFTNASIFRICFSLFAYAFSAYLSISVKKVIAEAMYARPIGQLYTHTQDLTLVTANDSLLIICLNIRPDGAKAFISIFFLFCCKSDSEKKSCSPKEFSRISCLFLNLKCMYAIKSFVWTAERRFFRLNDVLQGKSAFTKKNRCFSHF